MNRIKGSNIIFIVLIIILATGMVFGIVRISMKRNSEEIITNRQNETRIQMSWWGNDGRHMYTMEGVDLFQDKNSDIAVQYRYGEWNGYEKRNKVWMESHTEADVMQINYAWIAEYSEDGTGFYDLNELSDYINLDNFTEEEKSYGMKNGRLNALPIAMNTHTFYYNQDVLDEYGVDVPDSWEALFEFGKKLAPDDKYALGMSKKQLFLLLIAYYEQSSGTAMFNEDGTISLDERGMEELLTFYKKLLDENVVCPVDTFDRAKYMSGDIVGTMCWISDTKIYCDGLAETGAKVSRGSYPLVDNAKDSGWYIKPATMWAISADTEHPVEAARLLDYLLNDPDMAKLQQTEKGVPVSDAAVDALNEEGLSETNEYKAIQDMTEHQDEMHLMIPNMENESIIDAFKSGADEYIFDKMSVSQCAKETLKAMKDIANGEEEVIQ